MGGGEFDESARFSSILAHGTHLAKKIGRRECKRRLLHSVGRKTAAKETKRRNNMYFAHFAHVCEMSQ
jgi:hypothetical protein